MKIITFREAVASGRRFRHAGPHNPNGHLVKDGHAWRVATNKKASTNPAYHPDIKTECAECGVVVGLLKSQPDQFIIERTDEELDQNAQDYITKVLGLKIRVTV